MEYKENLPNSVYKADDKYKALPVDYKNSSVSSLKRRSPLYDEGESVVLKKVLNAHITLEDMIGHLHGKQLTDRQYDNVIDVLAILRDNHPDVDYEFMIDEFWPTDINTWKRATFTFWSPVKSLDIAIVCYPDGVVIPRAIYPDKNVHVPIPGAEVAFSLEALPRTIAAVCKFLEKVC